MIKKNKATECGVTNGAEGIVVGWKARSIDSTHETLDVLFVKLTSPPSPIKLQGLPENVVPITSETINLKITLPMKNSDVINITRHQVPIVLNFAHSRKGNFNLPNTR